MNNKKKLIIPLLGFIVIATVVAYLYLQSWSRIDPNIHWRLRYLNGPLGA